MSSVGIDGKLIVLDADGVADLTGVDTKYFPILRAQGWAPCDTPAGYVPPADPSSNTTSVLAVLAKVEALSDQQLEDELVASKAVLAAGASREAAVQAVLALRLEAARVAASAGKPSDVASADVKGEPAAAPGKASGGVKRASGKSTFEAH